MPKIDQYEPGTPSWVDLASPDLPASVSFYSRPVRVGAPTTRDPMPAATPSSAWVANRSREPAR